MLQQIIIRLNNVFENYSELIIISNEFIKSVDLANNYVDRNIITFGITPKYPETGYGYIIYGEDYKIKKFIEKPDMDVAKKLIEDSNCLWNSGIFYFNKNVLKKEFLEYQSDLFIRLKKSYTIDNNHIDIDMKTYTNCPEIPFDKLIMEKTNNGTVIPFNGFWSDIDTWDSFIKIPRIKSNDNDIHIDNNNSHVFNYNKNQLIATIGLENILIVNTPDALLISNLSDISKIKTIYKQIDNKNSAHI